MDGITLLAGVGTPTPLPHEVLPCLERVEISDLPRPAAGVSLSTAGGARISAAGGEIRIDNGHGAAIVLTGNHVHITGVMV